MDLYGAPYAYTPFCSSRKEMDGFRYDKLFLGRLEITLPSGLKFTAALLWVTNELWISENAWKGFSKKRKRKAMLSSFRLNWTLCERADLRRGLTFG